MPGALYVSAFLSRAGLGNMLFPWARAVVFAHTHGLHMLAPQWVQLKIGPILRREKDKRFYIGLFSPNGYVRGPAKWLALATGTRLPEPEHAQTMDRIAQGWTDHGTLLFHFAGMEREFAPFQAYQPLVRERLLAILSPRIKTRLAREPEEPFIGIHVRRGDVTLTRTLAYGEPFPPGLSFAALPLEWFVHTLAAVRAALGRQLPARVFSDAPASELSTLLQAPHIRLMPPAPSIVDILLLARSTVAITSGSSTFSKWAGFLGGMPCVYYPTLKSLLNPSWPFYAGETDLQGNLPDDVANALSSAITASA